MKGAKGLPARAARALVESWQRAREIDEVEITIACYVQKLLTPPIKVRSTRARGDGLQRAKPAFTKIGFVKPGSVLFCQHAGDTLPIEIDPAVAVGVDAGRHVGKALFVHLLKFTIEIFSVFKRTSAVRKVRGRE